MISKGWDDMKREFGVSGSLYKTHLLELSEGLAKKWAGRDIVPIVDEIYRKALLSNLGEQSFPESVRMILIVNPDARGRPLALPPSVLHVTLTIPYRSTIAITSLARFIAKCKNLVVPEGDFGSDVVGTKPLFFDVGLHERKLKEALEHCYKHLGDNVTILYSGLPTEAIQNMVKNQGKEEGGLWDCYYASDFYGWEAERVVAVTTGLNLMEQVTRARTHLAVILSGDDPETKSHFQQAAREGLVDAVHQSAN